MSSLYRRVIEVEIEGRKFSEHEIEFGATATLSAAPNEAEVRMYNLGPDDRAVVEGYKPGALLQIAAGYLESGPSVIYEGLVKRAHTERQEQDLVTIVESASGHTIRGVGNRLDKNYKSGTSLQTVINDLIKACGADKGNVGVLQNEPAFAAKLNSPLYISGPAWDMLRDMVQSRGYDIAIVGRRIDVQSRGRATNTQVVAEIGYDSGLIGTPSADSEGVLTVQCVLIPNILPGSIIQMRAPSLNGTYKVTTTTHSGSLYSPAPMMIEIEAVPT